MFKTNCFNHKFGLKLGNMVKDKRSYNKFCPSFIQGTNFVQVKSSGNTRLSLLEVNKKISLF